MSIISLNGRRRVEDADEPRPIGLGDLLGRESGSLLFLLILFIGLSLASDVFLTSGNMDNLARQVAVYGIIAVAQLLVIITAGIDLSVGSVLGLTGAITAQLLVDGMPVPIAILAALLIGMLIGIFNGSLVAFWGLPPFIVTLGVLGMARGLTLVITGAETIQPLPEGFSEIANGSLLGLPNLLWIMVAITLAVAFLLRRTVFGRYLYAVGSNIEAARLAGVPVRKVQIAAYAIAGALAGLAGVLITSRLSAGIPTAGTGYELQAIAACVIGGASLFGAKGGAFGALAGALIVGVLNNGGNLLAIDSFYLQIATGALILLAVALDHFQGRRRRAARKEPEVEPVVVR